jgi:thiamine-monophosphate kinase
LTAPPTISALGERQLVERLKSRFGPDPDFVEIGIGDDAAVVEGVRGESLVVTTDSLVEGVHFARKWTSLAAVGHKALAVNLSDIAAMGARPRFALLSLALPAELLVSEFDELIDGFATLATRTGTTLVGGNLTRSPGPIIVDVTVGGAGHRRKLLRRTGARPGDRLFVTGLVGGAGAGLEMLEQGLERNGMDPDALDCLRAIERPEPRLRLGSIVGRSRAAAAAIDLSDGLADAAVRLAEAAGLGVAIDGASVPVHPGARTWWSSRGGDPVAAALASGEDYELAFAVRPRLRRRFLAAAARCSELRVTDIGEFTRDAGFWCVTGGARAPIGPSFQHF